MNIEGEERKKETHERIGKKKNIQKKLQIRKPTAASRKMQLVHSSNACDDDEKLSQFK